MANKPGSSVFDMLRQQHAERAASTNHAQCNQEHPPDEQREDEPGEPESTGQPHEPDWTPFPVKHLPEPIAGYVEQVADSLGCDPAFVALPCLSVAAACIGTTRRIRLKAGWEEPAGLWTCIVGESGSSKTPALTEVVRPMAEMNADLLDGYLEERHRHEQVIEERKGRKNLTTMPPPEPVRRHLLCSDVTIEKLGDVLAHNPRGVLVYRDELSAWFGSFTRYKTSGTDQPAWLSLHQAGTLTVDRKTGKDVAVRRALVSIAGGIQPAVLGRCLTDSVRQSGLMARLLFAMPPRKAKKWRDEGISPEARQTWESLLRRLLSLNFAIANGKPEPITIDLSGQAKEKWVQWYNEWNATMAEEPGELVSIMSKLEATAPRLALIHHVVYCAHNDIEDQGWTIGPESIDAGIALAEWFLAEARRVLKVVCSVTAAETADKILKRFGTKKIVTQRDLMQWDCRAYPNAKVAETVLVALVREGRARWWNDKEKRPSGVPTKAVELIG